MLFLHICVYILLNVVQYYPVLEETSTNYYLAISKLEFQNCDAFDPTLNGSCAH